MTTNTNPRRFRRTSNISLGEHRGNPRVYLQGKYLLQAGFESGRQISATFERGRVVINLADDGERRVSGKQNGAVPVIDINSSALRSALGDAQRLTVRIKNQRIVIERERTEARKASRPTNGLEGSLFSGGGLMSEAARQAGFKPAWAVEIDPTYADTFGMNHSDAHVYNMSVHEVPTNELKSVELLTAGIPCQPFSRKRRSGDALPEAHDLGDMTFWTLRIIDAVNPRTVVIEQVEHYLSSASYHVLNTALNRMGYDVEARVMDPADYGHLAGRRRAVIVATTDGSFVWPEPQAPTKSLGSALEDVADDSDEWFDADSKPWLFNHWAKQTAKGNGFAKGIKLTADSTRVPCISKRYFSQQGDGAVVTHPSRPDTYRWLRVSEVARLMGADGWNLPTAKTRAGEILGQAVHVGLFADVMKAAA
jgi:DNA (cytosine-5)-methyltransferase 1